MVQSILTSLVSEPSVGSPPSQRDSVHLVFAPSSGKPRLLLWGAAAKQSPLAKLGVAAREQLLDESLQAREIEVRSLPLLDATFELAAMTTAQLERSSASCVAWSLAAKLALELVTRQRIVPQLVRTASGWEARFAVGLALPEDADRFTALAKAMPPAAHAFPVLSSATEAPQVWSPEALLRAFLDSVADQILRKAAARPGRKAKAKSWEQVFTQALLGPEAAVQFDEMHGRAVPTEIESWVRPALGAQPGAARVCLALEMPDAEPRSNKPFCLRFLLQLNGEPESTMAADQAFMPNSTIARRMGGARKAEEYLLRTLVTAARIFPAIEQALREVRPTQLMLDAKSAWTFIDTAAAQLREAGIRVIIPAEFHRSGERRLRLRLLIGAEALDADAGSVPAQNEFLTSRLPYRWQAELAGEVLSEADLDQLSQAHAPLVRHRGRWVAVNAAELEEAHRLIGSDRSGYMNATDALAASLTDSTRQPTTHLPVELVPQGELARVQQALLAPPGIDVTAPADLNAVLRPYQSRGYAWLAHLAELGFGACLADDMGLGKTVQLLALLLHLKARSLLPGPVLIVCPTSVIGNWEREISRFAPTLRFVRHHSVQRYKDSAQFTAQSDALFLTSYGLLRRDAEMLGQVEWGVVALDEAQNIKNPTSRTARAARTLRASFRVTLTGTPMENHTGELWSISEFLNPRLLGPYETFKRTISLPIERFGDEQAAEYLRRVMRPFILRRLKSDPNIIADLPPKQEMKVICSLTREQASLYQSAVDEAMQQIEASSNIERRGRILALLTALKQICNHPAQYLHEAGPLAGRSGKLQRLIEMLEVVQAAGDRALVFTQYREMGERLVKQIERALHVTVPFLHGGTPRTHRDAMVQRFQSSDGPPVLVLSLRAGGTGLNLTAATHVFHFDRWWNPAVEDQASDRAYRIGQHRTVQVHKLMCAGTIEDRVDQLLEQKRELASRVVGESEQWITELSSDELLALVTLTPDAVVDEPIDDEQASRSPREPLAKALA